MYPNDIRNTSMRQMFLPTRANGAWRKCEIDDKIWQMNMDLDDFLHFFVPSDKAVPPSKARNPFNVPVGGREIDMYEPLVCDVQGP